MAATPPLYRSKDVATSFIVDDLSTRETFAITDHEHGDLHVEREVHRRVRDRVERLVARQLDRIETLLQALEYEKKDKQVNILSFWYQLKELADDPVIIEFMEGLDSYFYNYRKTDPKTTIEKFTL